MSKRKLSFKNREGHELVAQLDLPMDGITLAYALFAHCFTCSKDLKAAYTISKTLTQAGIAVLRFDFTGLGESEGEFAETQFSTNISDLLDAANFLKVQYEAPQLLIGHSLGGAAVLMAAPEIDSVKGVVTIAAPAEPAHVKKLFASRQKELEEQAEAEVVIAGRNFKIKKQFIDDLNSFDLEAGLGKFKAPLLVFHSPVDSIVGVENAREIYLAARHPKSFVSLDQADHLLSKESDSRYVGQVIAAWASKYLSLRDNSWHQSKDDNRVYARTEDSFQTTMMANGFALIADEPTDLGGTNLGPTPYDYLASALAACTSMTLRMYADRKKWRLSAVTTEVKPNKVHQTDSPNAEKDRKVDQFKRLIKLEGELSEEERHRLLEIANRCPVHRTLESASLITSELV